VAEEDVMPMTNATPLSHVSGAPHFEVHRSLLTELLADAALLAAWTLLWAIFTLALAPLAPPRDLALPAGRIEPAAVERSLDARSREREPPRAARSGVIL
jgi:hypothetical protein